MNTYVSTSPAVANDVQKSIYTWKTDSLAIVSKSVSYLPHSVHTESSFLHHGRCYTHIESLLHHC